jgi:hypothetical protein
MTNNLIQFSYQLSEQEHTLVELQGSLDHTVEKKFNDLYLGRLEKKTEVKFFKNRKNTFLLSETIFLLAKRST